MNIFEIIAKICAEYLMPFLATFSDSPLKRGGVILVAALGIVAFLMKIIPDRYKPISLLIGFGVIVAGVLIHNLTPSSTEDAGDLKIAFQVMLAWTEDGENGEVCVANPVEELNVENISMIFKTNDTVYEYSDFSNNILQFEQLPAGSYELSVKFEDYFQKNQEFILSEDDLKNGQWVSQTVTLKSQNSSENLDLMISIQDEPDKVLKNAKITLQPEGSAEKVSIPLDKKGKPCKKVSVAENVPIQAEVDYGEGKQVQNFTVGKDKKVKANKKLKKEEKPGDAQSDVQDIPDNDYEEDEPDEEDIFIEDQKLYLTFYKPEIEQTEQDTWRLECDEQETARETEILQNNPKKLLAEQASAVLDRESFDICKYTEGMLTFENPQENYSVDLESNSYWIEFEQAYPYGYDMSCWHIMIIDDSEDIRLEFTASTDSEKTISDIVDLEAGNYHICVESYDGDGVFDTNYTLYLKELYPALTSSDEAEEFGEEHDYTDTFIYGYVSQPDDIDNYCFQLETDAVVAFKFEHMPLSNYDAVWNIRLKNESGDIIKKLSVPGNESEMISNNIGLASGEYTIEVSAGEDYYCSEIYALSIKQYVCNYWEKEPNSAFSHDEEGNSEDEFWAMDDTDMIDDYYDTEDEQVSDLDRLENDWFYADTLANGVGIYANLSDKNDVDNFMFVCPESGSYDLICKHNGIMTDSPGLYISIYNSSGSIVEDYQFYSDWNEAEIMNSVELVEGEIYYITVESGDGWLDEDYLLRIVSNYIVSTNSAVSVF